MTARINVEAEFWDDPRLMKFAIKVGSELIALGAMLKAWKLSQQYATPESLLIPHEVWEREDIPEAIFQVDLAVRQESGVYVRGSEKHHNWLRQLRENGRKGGKASASSRAKTNGSAQPLLPKQGFENPEAGLEKTEAGLQGKSCGQNDTTPEAGLRKIQAGLRETRSVAQPSSLSSLSSSLCIDSSNTHTEPQKRNERVSVSIPELNAFLEEWTKTLRHHGSSKDARLDEVSAARVLQKWPLERAILALRGMRLEQSSQDYDPRRNLFLRRLFNRDSFERLETLGTTAPESKQRPETTAIVIRGGREP